MTIPEPTEGDLSSNMFENMGVTPRKTAQWQPTQNVASMRHLFRLIADPNPSQEMDLVDQDTCLSRPYDSLNAQSFGEDQEHGLMPTCTQSSAGLSYHLGTTNVEPVEESIQYASHPAVPQDGQEQVRVYTQGTGLLSHSGRFNGEPVLYTTRLAPHQEDQEQVRICTQGTSHLGKFNAEHVGETAHPAGVQEAQEQGPMLTYMQCLDQSRQFYGTQNTEFSVSPEMHMWNTQTKHHPGTCNMEPNRHIPSPSDMAQKDLMQRSAVTSKQGTCFRPGSGMGNTNPLGEPAPVACPQMQWPSFGIDGGTPLWSHFDTTITRPFVKFRPAAAVVQDPGWVAMNMHDTCYKGHSGPTNVETFMQGQPLLNIQGENFLGHSALCNTDSSGRQMSLPAVVQDKQVMPEQVQHRWASTNTHDSNLFSHQGSCNPQAFGGFEPSASPQVTELEGQAQGCALTNTALLHQFGAFNANTFVLNGVQEEQVQAYALTNTDLLCQFGTCNANPSLDSSPEDTGNHNHTILTTGYCTSTQKALEAHSKSITDGLPDMGHMHQSPSACGNAGARTGQHGTMVSKSRRLSALRTVMRKGKSAEGRGDDRGELDPNKEAQLKPRRKKLRAKVLKDRSKSKVRQGSKTGKGKDIPEATGLHGDEGPAARDGKIAEAGYPSFGETSNFSQLEPFQEGITKKSICQDGGQGFELFCHEGTIYGDESVSAGTGLSINRQENSSWHEHTKTGEDQVAVPNSETYTLVDYFALSECRAGLRDPLLGNAVIEPERLVSECREIVLYGQCSDEPEAQHSHCSNLPLCLFSGETSSSGSTKLVPAGGSSNHLPLAKVAPDDNLQLVLYNQKRDIIVSKPARTFKKIRAKVQLDPESQRVWLQLENGGSPQADSDPDKARHWEKEREEMKKKVDFFIHKMHVVQGDRRFSPWKGSIVDSVVGAFLTQNVSDHLSSSAFMSVASRFPVLKKDSVVARADEICTIPCEKQCDVEVLPFIMEKGFFGSEEELSLDKQGDVNSNNSLCDDESTAVEVGSGEVTGFCKPVQHDDRGLQSLYGDYEGGVRIVYEGYYNASTSTPDSQPCEKKVQHLLLASDDERNSSCAIEEDADDGGGTMEEVCGAFRQCCTLRNSKARRMLNFGTEVDKQEPGTCSVLETVKQVSFAPMHDTEMASDNISDQQSESESAVGSSSTVQSVQDSNFQLATVQESNRELDFQNNMIQASSQELETAAAPQVNSKTGKKRPLSISSMSGMERAQLEVSQKGRKKNHHRDWESVRKQVLGIPGCGKENSGAQKPRSHAHEDSVNWDAVRLSELGELAETIKERGMHHVLSGRIKAFLTSLYEEHGSVDLEWLRNLSTETAREYLMSIHGLGVKSVECIRLLTLHHLAFPVDTNVGRICVRLGWVPIEPLPEEVQLHLVELYPIQETIQKYLWPRLCTLDQRTLYELHYQLITFGKVFCTKSKPNCNACPMRTECKHFASAYASAKPLLTGPKEEQSNRICSGSAHKELPVLGMDTVETALLDYPHDKPVELSLSEEAPLVSEIDSNTTLSFEYHNRPLGVSYSGDFYVEEPTSPEPTYGEDIMDIEDMGAHMYIYKNYNDYSLDLIGNDLSLVQSTNHSLVAIGDQCSSQDLKNVHTQSTLSTDPSQFDASHSLLSKDQCCSPYQCSNGELAKTSPRIPYCGSQSITRSDSTSDRPTYQTDIIIEVAQNAIVAVPEVAQIPAPKLKNIGRLRTIHYVYELPDGHSLLKMVDVREKDDPCSYLLAIWSPGETPESQQEIDELCRDESSMHSSDKSFGADETVSGTLLIPCRTAMHGSFPLNGTYFQVNEVFADHESSLDPLQVPRSLIWSLRRRFVYFGTSVPNIFKGLSTDEIKDCFWRGHVCVRGFDRQTRAPKPLVCRLHFPISKQQQKTNKKHKGKKNDEKSRISSTLHK